MATYMLMFLTSMLLTQAFCATEVNSIGQPIKSLANLPYEELVFILQSRLGIAQKPRTLSPCARAILGCCKENRMNEHCSESLNCGAFFFDDNPCEDRFIIDALQAAKSFYTQLKEK